MKVSKKAAPYAFMFFVFFTLILGGCGGGGSGGGATQGSGLLIMNVSPSTISTEAEGGSEEITVEFTLNNYSENLPALPVAIERYIVSFERTDCTGCPVPEGFTIGSGAYLEAGETYSETITLITEQLKRSLPIAAVRDDEYNPVANQSVPVDTEASEILARARTETIARFGTPYEELVATGNGVSSVFTGTVTNPPVIKGTFRVLVTGNPFGYTYETIGEGGSYSYSYTVTNPPVVPGSISIVVFNNKRTLLVGTGDGATTDFIATLVPPVLEGSLVIKVGETIAGSDDGNGNISGVMIASGTINYSTGEVNISFATPPASGETITAEYLNSAETLVATDDAGGQITGENGYAVSGYIDYSTGEMAVNFGTPPFIGSTVGLLYLSAGSEEKVEVGADNGNGEISGTGLTGTVDYDTGYFVLTFTSPPYSGQHIYIRYSYGTGSSVPGEVVYTLSGVPIVPGSVVITDGTNILATDDGYGNLNGQGAGGTVSYNDGSIIITVNADTSRISTLNAVYATLVSSGLSMYPVVPGSVEISTGDGVVCTDVPDGGEYATTGVLGYPCGGVLSYTYGTITGFKFFSGSADLSDLVVSYLVRTSSYLGGDRNLAIGDGITTKFNLYLHYPPVESPHGDYAAVVATSDGLRAVDTGGGTLTGDVCTTERSYIDYQTGYVHVCFSNPPATGAEIFALYRTSTIRMNARIKAEGHEIGGKSISVDRTVTITVH